MDDQLATADGDAATARVRAAALAVDELVPTHTPMLWQVARAAGLGQQDAEDVVQTVWVSLLSHLDTIRSPDALTGWLVTATRREAWRVSAAGRKTQPAEHEFLVEIPDPRAGSEERVLIAEEQRALWAALAHLGSALPGAAADRRVRAAPRLRPGGGAARDAPGQRRPDPAALPGQAARRPARQRGRKDGWN